MIPFELHLISLTNSENMAAVKPSIKDILCLEKIPIILGKSYEIEVFVMGHHVYKQTWAPFFRGEIRCSKHPSNIKDKYVVAIFQGGRNKVIGHLSLGKSGKFAKTIFHFLKAAKENRCQTIVLGKVVNKNDGLEMKVPSRLIFTAEEK